MSEFGLAKMAEHARAKAEVALIPSEARLWVQIADEIDVYLAPHDDGPDLFGETP